MKLILNNGNAIDSSNTASLLTKWCLTNEELVAVGDKPAFVVICTRYNNCVNNTYRYIYPLQNAASYVPIEEVGTLELYGYIVTWSGNEFDVRQWLRTHIHPNEYINPDGTPNETMVHRSDSGINHIAYTENYTVHIDSLVLGKQLPKWLEFYVYRYWYNERPADECELRRRVLIFAVIGWLILLFEVLCIEVYNIGKTLLYASVGTFLNWHKLRHPFSTEVKPDYWSVEKFIDNIAEGKYKGVGGSEYGFAVLFIILPLLPAIHFIGWGIICTPGNLTYSFLETVHSIYTGETIFSIVVFIVASILLAFISTKQSITDKPKPKPIVEETYVKYDHNILSTDRQLTFSEKPMVLVISDVKSLVCKPLRK